MEPYVSFLSILRSGLRLKNALHLIFLTNVSDLLISVLKSFPCNGIFLVEKLKCALDRS